MSARQHHRPQLVAAIVAAAALGACAQTASAAIIIGTPGPDRLVGSSPAGDLLFGGGGANTLIGGPGNDVIYGVRSSNAIHGGAGNNYSAGGGGGDRISVGSGNNTIYGGSGLDSIVGGDGNNYVDPGGAPDTVTLGNGNNVLNGGSGGVTAKIGNGSNTVYMLSGPDDVRLGTGVNHVYTAGTHFHFINCGGNPQSVLYVNAAADPTGKSIQFAVRNNRVMGCPTIETFTGPLAIKAEQAGTWSHYALTAGNERVKLFGGHGGGTITAGDGDDILWADSIQATGGVRAQANTSKIVAGNGNNQIYGGRGTNFLSAGNGNNYIRAGAFNNHISVGAGDNVINLQGHGTNTVTINGGHSYVSSFSNGARPVIKCVGGATATVIYGNTRPVSNCGTIAPARSKKGQLLQVEGVSHIIQSDAVVPDPIEPGQDGVGVPRPTTAASLEALR